jgi:hypothetical protein
MRPCVVGYIDTSIPAASIFRVEEWAEQGKLVYDVGKGGQDEGCEQTDGNGGP